VASRFAEGGGARGAGTVSGQGGQTLLEKFFVESAQPGYQFAHPGFNKMGGQRPSRDYLSKSLLKSSLLPPLSLCVAPAYAFVCKIISNRNMLAVTAVHECQEF